MGAKASGWTVNRGGISTDSTPEFGLEIAKRLRHAPVQLWYGRYVLNADNTHTRTGGHAVTVIAAKGDVGSGKVELTLHDPGRAADHKIRGLPGHAVREPRREGHALPDGDQREVDAGGPERGTDHQAHTYWRLVGENYVGDTFQYVDAMNWFEAAPPVG